MGRVWGISCNYKHESVPKYIYIIRNVIYLFILLVYNIVHPIGDVTHLVNVRVCNSGYINYICLYYMQHMLICNHLIFILGCEINDCFNAMLFKIKAMFLFTVLCFVHSNTFTLIYRITPMLYI